LFFFFSSLAFRFSINVFAGFFFGDFLVTCPLAIVILLNVLTDAGHFDLHPTVRSIAKCNGAAYPLYYGFV